MSNQLAFNDTQLSTLNRNNQVWLSSAELAKALQYKSAKSVTNIFNSNSDEFTPFMTEVIESVTSGNLKVSTRIFSLRGCHLIAMFSRTKIAKEFRKWVLDILDKQVRIINTITTEQQHLIRKAVDERAYRTGEKHQTIYHKLYDQFKIPRYQDLPAIKFNEAIDFLGGINCEKKLHITESNLIALISQSLWVATFYREHDLGKAFKMLGSDFGYKMKDHIESCYTLSLSLKDELNKSQTLRH